MLVFTLVTYTDHEIGVELFSTRDEAENAFMRDLFEVYQDCDLPDKYDEIAISDWICSMGESLVWSIEEHTSFVDSANRC